MVLRRACLLLFPLLLCDLPPGQDAGAGALGANVPPATARPAVTVHEDLQYAEGFAREPRRNRLDLYLPAAPTDAPGAGATRPPLLMFVHGGTWSGGSKDRYAALGTGFANAGIACAVINTQQHPFASPPAMVDDCAHALGWLREHGPEYGFDGEALFLMGHSSGAHLVSCLALDGERLRAAGVPRRAVRGTIGLSGIYDVRPRHAVLDTIFGNDAAARAAVSPVLHTDASAPPFLLLWGQQDMPGLGLSARMLQRRLLVAGVPAVGKELPGRNHVDYVLQMGQPGDATSPQVLAFVRERLATAPTAAAVPRPAGVRQVAQPARDGAPPVELWLPQEGRSACWLAFAACGADEGRLARQVAAALVPCGVAVAVVELGAATALRQADGQRAFAAAVARLAAAPQGELPPGAPFVAGYGVGGWIAATVGARPALGELRVQARVLLAAPTGLASLRWLLPQFVDAATGADAEAVLAPSSPPLLLVTGDQDPGLVRGDGRLLGARLPFVGNGSLGVELPGETRAALQRLGAHDDSVLPLVLAFLGVGG